MQVGAGQRRGRWPAGSWLRPRNTQHGQLRWWRAVCPACNQQVRSKPWNLWLSFTGLALGVAAVHENDLEVSEQAPAMTRGITLKDSFVVLLPSMPGTAWHCLFVPTATAWGAATGE